MLAGLYKKYLKTEGVCTDTRKIIPGSIFFALKGENFNANEFALEALEKGAQYVVVEEEKYSTHERAILVPNVLETLQQLARHHRDQLQIPVIGLTGSNGKTTSKELLNAVLSKKFKTLATKGNLNNHIGVPLTILSIDHSVELAIIEMGANHLGEIALLCSIANPTHGFITNIGKAHIGTFGGFENIIRGKSELYQHLINTNGTVWINSGNPILENMSKRFKTPLFYPAKEDFLYCELISADPYLSIRTETTEIHTQLVGAYNFENVAAALCAGKFFEVSPVLCKEALESYVPGNMRSQVVTKGSNTIILDAYNANPSSMEVAIGNLGKMKAKKRVAILGDMYELGDDSEAEHKKIGDWIQGHHIDEAIFCGKLIAVALQSGMNAQYFPTKEELIKYLKSHPIEEATILVKASRGMALESVIDNL